MVWAISSGLPTRLSGTPAIKLAFLSSVPVNRVSMPVPIGPGATTLTRTPAPAASRAADFVSPSTACLLAAYTEAPAPPVWPKVEDTLMLLRLDDGRSSMLTPGAGPVLADLEPPGLYYSYTTKDGGGRAVFVPRSELALR